MTSISPRCWSNSYEGAALRPGGSGVRVVDYRLKDVKDVEPIYLLITTILDHEKAPAKELAALYRERWEIETALDELKTHLRGTRIVLRSKTPELVQQEFFVVLMAHFAIRGLMQEAALKADEDPFPHSAGVVERRVTRYGAIPAQRRKTLHEAILHEILEEPVCSSRNRINPRSVNINPRSVNEDEQLHLRLRKRKRTRRLPSGLGSLSEHY